jgi:hypothetical protein
MLTVLRDWLLLLLIGRGGSGFQFFEGPVSVGLGPHCVQTLGQILGLQFAVSTPPAI